MKRVKREDCFIFFALPLIFPSVNPLVIVIFIVSTTSSCYRDKRFTDKPEVGQKDMRKTKPALGVWVNPVIK